MVLAKMLLDDLPAIDPENPRSKTVSSNGDGFLFHYLCFNCRFINLNRSGDRCCRFLRITAKRFYPKPACYLSNRYNRTT